MNNFIRVESNDIAAVHLLEWEMDSGGAICIGTNSGDGICVSKLNVLNLLDKGYTVWCYTGPSSPGEIPEAMFFKSATADHALIAVDERGYPVAVKSN